MRGLTRETLIALAADIETRIWRAKLLEMSSLPPEHPRSSTTDDVECFFSILRDTVGKDFTLQQVSKEPQQNLSSPLGILHLLFLID